MKRLEGLDFARSLAILGMMLVNYSLVFEAGGPKWLSNLVQNLCHQAFFIYLLHQDGQFVGLLSVYYWSTDSKKAVGFRL
ncbi:hypothetical protein [Alkaliphilus flagellatus]|uniref:hypothetical protein n=1 Tax=Alkaliphilus flagellatus TaxID=2841507 RepID=UPI001FE930B5|nr:hypothetical protein [Alkaliphilus flagellatus]